MAVECRRGIMTRVVRCNRGVVGLGDVWITATRAETLRITNNLHRTPEKAQAPTSRWIDPGGIVINGPGRWTGWVPTLGERLADPGARRSWIQRPTRNSPRRIRESAQIPFPHRCRKKGEKMRCYRVSVRRSNRGWNTIDTFLGDGATTAPTRFWPLGLHTTSTPRTVDSTTSQTRKPHKPGPIPPLRASILKG